MTDPAQKEKNAKKQRGIVRVYRRYDGFEVIDAPRPGPYHKGDTLALFKGIYLFTPIKSFDAVRKVYFDPAIWPSFDELVTQLDDLAYLGSLKAALTCMQNRRDQTFDNIVPSSALPKYKSAASPAPPKWKKN